MKKKRNKIIGIGILIVLLMCLCVCLLFIYGVNEMLVTFNVSMIITAIIIFVLYLMIGINYHNI